MLGGELVMGATENPSSESVDETAAFDTLSNERRRMVVRDLLANAGGETEIGDLAARVAAYENDTAPSEVTPAQRRRVYTALQQSHLPRMADQDLIEYDSDYGVVRATEHLEDLRVYLEVVPQRAIPWSTYYLLLSVLGASVVAAAALGLPPFAALPSIALAGGLATMFIASAIVHVVDATRRRIDRPS
ncbi:MAG: hypothetical protein ABEJ57_08110 [Halobacteriaceae archaeon]